MAFTGELFLISAGDYRASIAEVGASLAGFWHLDGPVTVDLPSDALPPKSAGAVLAPWPNRIRDGKYTYRGVDYQLPLTEPAAHNASHGFAKWSRWNLVASSESSVTLALDLVPQTGYPFEIRLTLTYSVDAASGLSVAASAVNTGVAAAPFGIGFHPYLDLGTHELPSVELLVPAASVLQADAQQIPVERLSVDGTPFDLRELRPLGSLRVDHGYCDLVGSVAAMRTEVRTVELRWHSAYRYLQVFTPPYVTPGRNAIAIEPMSCPANAFNSGEGLVSLSPGATWSGEWGIAVTG